MSLDDLIEAVERITGTDENGRLRIDRQSAERVAQTVTQFRLNCSKEIAEILDSSVNQEEN